MAIPNPAGEPAADASAAEGASLNQEIKCAPASANNEQFCPSADLTLILADIDRQDKVIGEAACRPREARDLEPASRIQGQLGDTRLGQGVIGDLDVDGDRRPDVLLTHKGLDSWKQLWFVRDEGCIRFVGFIDGYQITLAAPRHHGMREVRVHTYPLQGVTETYRYDGSKFKLSPR